MKLIRLFLIGTILVAGAATRAGAGAGFYAGQSNAHGNAGKARRQFSAGDSLGYRTFAPDSIIRSRDSQGRPGKYVKRKSARVLYTVRFRNSVLGADGLHIEFSAPIDTAFPIVMNRPGQWNRVDSRFGKWEIAFPSPLDGGDTLLITVNARSTKPIKLIKYFWRVNTVPFQSHGIDDTVLIDVQKYPMPNRINALYDAFMLGGFGPSSGLVVGVGRYLDSARYYGWLQAENYLDVLKSLSDRAGYQTGWPRGLDYFTTLPSRPILRRQKYIGPSRQNNKLLAGMIALKLNIVASELGITPPGFGELIYDDSSANPLNGLMVKEIADLADTMMSGWYDGVTKIHTWPLSPDFVNLSATVDSLNAAFEGPLDTVKFFDTLRFAPTRIVADVPYLFANPKAVPARIAPSVQRTEEYLPDRFSLLQNYPNPFNPTTTIEFNLPVTSTISLTVYNLLGQNVLTLYDHAVLEDGLYEAEVNGANLASGVYFYHLVADEIGGGDAEPGRHLSAVKKMILMR